MRLAFLPILVVVSECRLLQRLSVYFETQRMIGLEYSYAPRLKRPLQDRLSWKQMSYKQINTGQ